MKQVALDKGYMVISLDTELIWGSFDFFGPNYQKTVFQKTREVINRLLVLFEQYEISATWGIVGHLFLDKCSIEGGKKHPDIIRPSHNWFKYDWFHFDPCSDLHSTPIWYGKDIVEKIKCCKVKQDIGSHSFSHVIFGDVGCSEQTAASELRKCVELAEKEGIKLKSFIFPRNSIGHLNVLKEYDFCCYRGLQSLKYSSTGLFFRFLTLLRKMLAKTPPVSLPEEKLAGFFNIPASMHWGEKSRFIPNSYRVRVAEKGIKSAIKKKGLFHLWFHPFEFATNTEEEFYQLEKVIVFADKKRGQGKLEICSMADLTLRLLPTPS